MDNQKKIKHINLREGESPEENSILDDLQLLVNSWRKDNLNGTSTIVSLQNLIDDYHSKPLTEMVGGDKEWHTKEQGEFFTLDGSENLGNTDYFKEDGFDIIHQSSGDHHLSDISPESEETYIPKGSKKVKKTVLKPQLNKEPFNISTLKEVKGDDSMGGFSKERFVQLAKAIAVNYSLDEIKGLLDEEHLDDIETQLIDVLKLYGITPEDLDGATSLTYRLLAASFDNYKELVNNEITNFDSLVVRPLKKYNIMCTQNITRETHYSYGFTIMAYNENSALNEVYENWDGQYSYWEYEGDSLFSEQEEFIDGDGIEVQSIVEDTQPIKRITEEDSDSYLSQDKNKITKISAAMMNHIRKDFSNDELESLLKTNPYDFETNVTNIMKLYSLTSNHDTKRLIQVMADNNWEKIDYKKLIGDNLSPLKKYTFMKSFEEVETMLKSATIEINDTNWESALCTATSNFWDWDPELDYLDTKDTDFLGSEVWEYVEVDDAEIWRHGDTHLSQKYNPNRDENCGD